jgi:HK97 family phage major capsid protein
MKNSERLRQLALEQLGKAKTLEAKAADGNISEDERSALNGHLKAATEYGLQRKTALADEDLLAQGKALSDELGLSGDVEEAMEAHVAAGRGGKSLGQIVLGSPQFKAVMEQFSGAPVPEKARVQSAPVQVKALLTGASQTSAGTFVWSERTDVVEMLGRRPLTVRDLVANRRTGSDMLEYVAQTSHTNNAAPVAEATTAAAPTAPGTAGALVLPTGGGYKPEGVWAFERRSTTVKTIAEWVPVTKRALSDFAALEGLINDELVADLRETEETQILNGAGTGENLLGILNTSGIQTQAKGTDDTFTAFRRALTKARATGRVVPNAILLNPAQMEELDLAKDGNDRFYGAGPFNPAGIRSLWGIALIESEAVPAGTALVGDFTKAVLWDREQATVTMTDSHNDFFTRNLVAILAEERLAFAVTRPTAFVTVTGL